MQRGLPQLRQPMESRDTARRVARMHAELFEGARRDPADYLGVVFDEHHDEMVLVRDVPFTSVLAAILACLREVLGAVVVLAGVAVVSFTGRVE